MDEFFSHEYFMKQALREAEKAREANEVPVGAIIVINNKIIGKGHNQVELLHDCTAHAEILAITSACNFLNSKYLEGATMYVTLEPCLMCSGALYWGKLEHIVFGAKDTKNGYSAQLLGSPFHPKANVISGIMEQECSQILKDFFIEKR